VQSSSLSLNSWRHHKPDMQTALLTLYRSILHSNSKWLVCSTKPATMWLVRNTPMILLLITTQKAHRITTKLTRGTMGVVKQVLQLDNHTDISPVTSIKASYYIEGEICMIDLMVDGEENVFLSII
jgi:hypothetical protein